MGIFSLMNFMNITIRNCTIAVTYIAVLLFAGDAAEAGKPAASDTFRSHVKAMYDRGAGLLKEGLQHINQYERIPVPDGVFNDYIDMLCALPPRTEHLPLIIKLIRKSDPYLQEAGIRLASSSVRALNDYTGLQAPICELLKRSRLDPWVLRAIVQFASNSNNTISPELENLFRDLAAVACRKNPKKPEKNIVFRSMAISPYRDAKILLNQVMLNTAAHKLRRRAILSYLENEFGTKGWTETYRTLMKNNENSDEGHFSGNAEKKLK